MESDAVGPLVSVVVPAYNAAATLGATIDSAARQTHRTLEILVVNDGSTDDTETIAREYAARDPRIRVVNRPNGGVAAARNLGIELARSDLVAPLDADDLWHPEKIARQLEILERGGPGMGFVYAGYRTIDAERRVRHSPEFRICEGRVFLRSLVINFVGNGSGLLIRREAVRQAGGYSEELRRQGLEGTEDWLLQSRMARRWTVGVAPAWLVGYRQLPGRMSADDLRMLRSRLLMLSMLAESFPETPGWVLRAARARTMVGMAQAFMLKGKPGRSSAALARAFALSPTIAAAECRPRLRGLSRKIASVVQGRAAEPPYPDFYSVGPEERTSTFRPYSVGPVMEMLARADAELAP